MSDQFVKPGNQERGWNDPPQFSYGLQKDSCGQKRNVLNKRLHSPQLTGSGSGFPPTPLDGLPLPRDRKPPPMDGVTPPSICPSIPSDVTMMAESEPCIEDVQAPLYWALQACRHTVKVHRHHFLRITSFKTAIVSCLEDLYPLPSIHMATDGTFKTARRPSAPRSAPANISPPGASLVNGPQHPDYPQRVGRCRKQICDDVERRLMLFENMWKNGKLSPLVKQRMHRLSQELKSKNWDTADEIHRGLMVDHIAEVSQWMVGVKRLIAEARNLNPELLQTGDLGQN